MARRRKKKGSSLLTRILVVSIAAHIVILPIAAHFGAFKNIRKGFGDSHIVMLTNTVKDEPDKPKAKEKAKKVEDHKKATSSSKASGKESKSNLPQPKVVTSGPATGTGGEGAGPTAESGSGTAGKVPDAGKAAPTNPKTEETEPKKPPVIETTLETKKPDPPKKDPVIPETTKPVEPKAKKIVEAIVAEAPEPEIPDELRTEPLDKALVVEAQIDTGGHPTSVTIASSTGIRELDRIGLDTAKKYRFKPATIDGIATEQRVRFRIIFKVE